MIRPPVFDIIQSRTVSSDPPSAPAWSCSACLLEWISARSRRGSHGRFPGQAMSAGSFWRQTRDLCRWPRPAQPCSDMFRNQSAPASDSAAPATTCRVRSMTAASGPEGAFFFRFFVRLEKTVGEFFPATLWVVIIQPILSSAGRYYHQLDRGWHFQTRPCYKLHPALFLSTG